AMRYFITGDTIIIADKGLLPIAEVSHNGSEDVNVRVLSMNGAVNSASKWWDCGPFPTRRVRTRRGYEVTGTTNHPLLVAVPDEHDNHTRLVWKTIAEIKQGDYLVIDRSEALWPEQQVDSQPCYPEIAQ